MLPTGSPIELELTNGAIVTVLDGVVVLASAERIAVQCPLSRKAEVTVEADSSVRVHTITGSTILSFETKVVAVTREPGLLVIALDPPDEVAEERREFYRLSYRVPVDVTAEDPTTPLPGTQPRSPINAHSLDFGGGGLALLSPVPVARGTAVALRLHLDDGEGPLVTPGTIVRLNEVPDREETTFRLGVSFGRIDQNDQRRLIQFIFAKQREYRRKGVL